MNAHLWQSWRGWGPDQWHTWWCTPWEQRWHSTWPRRLLAGASGTQSAQPGSQRTAPWMTAAALGVGSVWKVIGQGKVGKRSGKWLVKGRLARSYKVSQFLQFWEENSLCSQWFYNKTFKYEVYGNFTISDGSETFKAREAKRFKRASQVGWYVGLMSLSVHSPNKRQSQHPHEGIDDAGTDGCQLTLQEVQASIPEDEGGVVEHLWGEDRLLPTLTKTQWQKNRKFCTCQNFISKNKLFPKNLQSLVWVQNLLRIRKIWKKLKRKSEKFCQNILMLRQVRI